MSRHTFHWPTPQRLAPLASAAALLLTISACGLPSASTTTGGPSATDPTSAEPTEDPTVIAPSGASVDPDQPTAPTSTSSATPIGSPTTPTGSGPGGDRPVATRPGSIDKVKVTATLYPVRRSGETSTVNVYIAADDPDDTFMLLNSLGDGNTETSSKSLTSVDGIKLVDPVAKKAYLPAVTADGQCVCAPDDANTGESRSSVWVTVTFAAPPPQLAAINVTVPTFGTYTDVPLR